MRRSCDGLVFVAVTGTRRSSLILRSPDPLCFAPGVVGTLKFRQYGKHLGIRVTRQPESRQPFECGRANGHSNSASSEGRAGPNRMTPVEARPERQELTAAQLTYCIPTRP